MRPGACKGPGAWTGRAPEPAAAHPTPETRKPLARPAPLWTPALRNGVSASRVAVPAGPWPTVLAFLQARFPAVAASWPARLDRGEVLDVQGHPLPAAAPCPVGSLLWYWRSPPPEPRVPFEIELLHQDAHLVVLDKPHFLPVTPGGRHLHETVLVRLRQLLGRADLVPLHRLDRETAGVMLFSAQPSSRDAYHGLLRGQQMHKVYEAIAPWDATLAWPLLCRSRLQDRADRGFMQAQVVPGAPNAETLIELIGRVSPAGLPGAWAHYRLSPRTGRRHQLRAQLNHLGLPILGDRIYPRLWPEPAADGAPDYSQALQLLARSLAFTDPLSGQPRHFASRRSLQWAAPAGAPDSQ